MKRLSILVLCVLLVLVGLASAQPNLPANEPVIRARYKGNLLEGLPGETCWPKPDNSPLCNFVDDPQPTDTIAVTVDETVTFVVDPDAPAPTSFMAQLPDKADQNNVVPEFDLLASNGDLRIEAASGLTPGLHRVSVLASYPGEVAGSEYFVTYYFRLEVSEIGAGLPTPEATVALAPTETLPPAETPAATPEPTETAAPTGTLEATEVPTEVPTEIATQTATQTATRTATEAPTEPAATERTPATATPTLEIVIIGPTSTPAVTAVGTVEATREATPTLGITAVATSTPTFTSTFTPTATPSPTLPPPTVTPSATPTLTPSSTLTPTLEGPTATPTLFIPTLVPEESPTPFPTIEFPTLVPSPTPIILIPTAAPTAAPSGGIPTLSLSIGETVFDPIAVDACTLSAGGQLECVKQPLEARRDRVLTVPGAVSRLSFSGPQPFSVIANLYTGDATTLQNTQRLESLNETSYIMPALAGTYVITVEIIYPGGTATYFFRVSVGS